MLKVGGSSRIYQKHGRGANRLWSGTGMAGPGTRINPQLSTPYLCCAVRRSLLACICFPYYQPFTLSPSYQPSPSLPLNSPLSLPCSSSEDAGRQ